MCFIVINITEIEWVYNDLMKQNEKVLLNTHSEEIDESLMENLAARLGSRNIDIADYYDEKVIHVV